MNNCESLRNQEADAAITTCQEKIKNIKKFSFMQTAALQCITLIVA